MGARPKEEPDSKVWEETSEEEEEGGGEDLNASSTPRFSRSGLRSALESQGGSVLPSFPSGSSSSEPVPSDLVVLSDDHCQTMSYLFAIAYGFPLVSYHWVHECITMK